MEIVGKVVRLGAITEGQSARGPWRKQDLIIETEGQYPRTVCLSCWTNQIEEIQHFAPGQPIKAQIELSSREFNNKWFTDVRVWRFDSVGATTPIVAQPQPMHQTPPVTADPATAPAQDCFPPAGQDTDDLPF